MTHKKQRLAILGSTGSIGTQTLDIVRRYGDLFEVTTLTARSRWEALVAQAIEFSPDNVVIADETYYPAVRDALADRPVKVYAGNDALEQVVRSEQVDNIADHRLCHPEHRPHFVTGVHIGVLLHVGGKIQRPAVGPF